MDRFVDSLTVLDGVALATGWSEDRNPRISIDGSKDPEQYCHRFDRPDVESFLGSGAGKRHGFKIAAFVKGLVDNSKLAVRFSDGEVHESATPGFKDRLSELLDRFVHAVEQAPTGSSLIELGSRARSGNSYRQLFPSIEHYTGVDLVDGDNVDVVADLHRLSKTIVKPFDFAFSVSVFEHLLMPWVVAVEVNRVLAQGGLAFVQSHPAWPLHDEPWDYFRFSKEAWHGLFNQYTGFEVLDTAYGQEARVVPFPACGGALHGLDERRTYLASGCLVQKISESKVDWAGDPSRILERDYGF